MKERANCIFFFSFFFKFYYLQRRRANSGDFQGIFGQLTNKSLDKKNYIIYDFGIFLVQESLSPQIS
jgi:hypothetical protein